MKSNIFPVMGSMRSQWDFYHGMGLAVSVFLTVGALVFWLLGNAVRESGADLQGVLVAFLLAYLALAAVSLRYFFFPPVLVELLIAVCLLMAVLAIHRPAVQRQ
jgi:heme A synthase